MTPILIALCGVLLFVLHFRYPQNRVTAYFVPSFPKDKLYAKSTLLRAGCACWVFAVWLLSISYFACAPENRRIVENTPFLIGLLFFAIPLAAMMCVVIGLQYFWLGVFGKGNAVRPALESIDAVIPGSLGLYRKKLKFYSVIAIACPILLVAAIFIEYRLGFMEGPKPPGAVVLLNVSFLIAFILSVKRVSVYTAKIARLSADNPNENSR